MDEHWGPLDNAALDKLFAQVQGQIYGYLRSMFQEQDAWDLVQETFIAALRHRHSFKSGNAPGWIFRIAQNIATRWKRGQAKHVAAMEQVAKAKEQDQSCQNDPAETAELNEGKQTILRQLHNLPLMFRIPVSMRHLEDKSYDEIAADLGISSVLARQRVTRGLQLLRKMKKRDDE